MFDLRRRQIGSNEGSRGYVCTGNANALVLNFEVRGGNCLKKGRRENREKNAEGKGI